MLTVDSVTDTTASVTVRSDPQSATLNVGEEKKFDLDGDGMYDFSVFLESITAEPNRLPQAHFMMKTISEAMGDDGSDDTADTTSDTEGTGRDSVSDTSGAAEGSDSEDSDSGSLFFIILVIVIVAAVGYFFYTKKK